MAKTTEVSPLEGDTLTFIPLAQIVDHPDKLIQNRPIDKAHVDELLESIKRNGLDTPLSVWNGAEAEETGEVVSIGSKNVPASYLVAGFHRRAALRKFLKTEPEAYAAKFPNGVPVRVFSGTAADMIALQLRENIARKNMDDPEILTQLIELVDTHKMKQKVVAKKIGKSEAWVSSILAIRDELGEDGVEAVKGKKVAVRDAIQAAAKVRKAKKSGDDDVDAGEELSKAVSKKSKAAAAGNSRAEKRVSAKVLFARVNALPRMAIGAKCDVVLGALAYLAGVEEELPEELSVEPEGDEEKPAKKAKKAVASDEDDE